MPEIIFYGPQLTKMNLLLSLKGLIESFSRIILVFADTKRLVSTV